MSSDAVKTGEPLAELEPGDEIRAFPHAGIKSAIDSALAAIPEGKHFATVGYYDLNGTARLAAMARGEGRLEGWTFAGVLAHDPPHGWSGEVAVMFSR